MELFDTCFFCHTPIKEGDNLVAVSHVTCTGYYITDDDRQFREFQDEIDTPYGAVYCDECWDSISAMLGRASECSLNLSTIAKKPIRYEVAMLHKEEGTITIESFDTLNKALQCLEELDLNGVSDKQLASAGLSPDSRDGIQSYFMDTWQMKGENNAD